MSAVAKGTLPSVGPGGDGARKLTSALAKGTLPCVGPGGDGTRKPMSALAKGMLPSETDSLGLGGGQVAGARKKLCLVLVCYPLKVSVRQADRITSSQTVTIFK